MKLDFNHLSFGYSPQHMVLDDVSFTLDGPGLACIIGPNGVGKSTLMKCLIKINKPTEGGLSINDRPISEMSIKDVSKIIGYVPPFSDDLFSMTVMDTILVGRHNHQKWRTSKRDLAMVHNVMELLDINDLAMQQFSKLSAGQHQRVALARGLVEETEILLLDEPTSNLDVRHQVFVIEMLRALAEADNKLILMISHDLNLAAKYAHKVILMEPPGKLRAIGDPAEVITEENIRDVYGVECEVIDHNGRPLVILGSALK